jgi:hypothetical protein
MKKTKEKKDRWDLRRITALGYSQLRVALPVLVHANELQQLNDDFLRARHVPLGKRALRRVPDSSREDVLRRELQLCTLVITDPILRDQRD